MVVLLQTVDRVRWRGGEIETVIIAERCGGVPIPIMAPTLWLASLAIEGKSINTLKGYAAAIKSFLKVLAQSENEGRDWKTISDREMSAYLVGYLKQACGLSDRSIARDIAALDGFYTWAHEKGFAITPPPYLVGLLIIKHGVVFKEEELPAQLEVCIRFIFVRHNLRSYCKMWWIQIPLLMSVIV